MSCREQPVAIEFDGKIPRTLLRLTEKGRKALLSYRRDMKEVLEDLAG